jgi:hypothetical protein
MNDVPFAESIFARLMQEHTGELGYLIEVKDIPYSQVGAALRANHIDVALYNGSLKNQLGQLKGTDHRFGNKFVLASHELYRYQRYPVLGCTRPEPRGKHKLSVPQNSDFELVISEIASKREYFRVPGVRKPFHLYKDVVYRESADEALADVVDGRVEYCLVGGLQERYAVAQFGAKPKSRIKSQVKNRVYLLSPLFRNKSGAKGGGARFWVAADRREQGTSIVNAMVAIWNESVVQEWVRLATAKDDKNQTELVEFINARRHKAFVRDFDELVDLIDKHDGQLKRVKLGIDDEFR